jgi:hypothetical protein
VPLGSLPQVLQITAIMESSYNYIILTIKINEYMFSSSQRHGKDQHATAKHIVLRLDFKYIRFICISGRNKQFSI